MCVQAAYNGHVKCVEALLTAGADVHAVDHKLGRSALHWAAHKGHVAAVEALMYAGADGEAAEHELQLTPLHLAMKAGHVAAVRAILYARSDRFLAPGRSLPGPSPLHWACAHGQATVLALLVSSALGADVLEREAAAGGTPLHAACFAGRCGVSSQPLTHSTYTPSHTDHHTPSLDAQHQGSLVVLAARRLSLLTRLDGMTGVYEQREVRARVDQGGPGDSGRPRQRRIAAHAVARGSGAREDRVRGTSCCAPYVT